MVGGYPAEHSGDLYKMTGKIKKIKKTTNGMTLIYYDDLQTSFGQSGAPVFLVRETSEGF